MVEGGNRAGKSVAVQAAAARLSAGRAVLWSDCTSSSTADTVLQRLYGLRRNLVVDYLAGFLRVSAGPPAEAQGLVLARPASAPEPALVVERAELLPLQELKRLLDFTKELADKGKGCIPVLDLTRSEALELLGCYCNPQRASRVYGRPPPAPYGGGGLAG